VQERVTFRCEDALTASLDGATVVFMYLLPRGIAQLQSTITKLAPGTRLVSYIFKVPFLEECEAQPLGANAGIRHVTRSSVVLAKPGRDRGAGEHSCIHIYHLDRSAACAALKSQVR
jgi:hypothetical protein